MRSDRVADHAPATVVANALDVLTWIVWPAAPATSLQSNGTLDPLAKRVPFVGDRSVGAARGAAGNGFTVMSESTGGHEAYRGGRC